MRVKTAREQIPKIHTLARKEMFMMFQWRTMWMLTRLTLLSQEASLYQDDENIP